MRRMRNAFKYSAAGTVALLILLLVSDALSFLVVGYPARAVLLPIEIAVCGVCTVASLGYALTRPDPETRADGERGVDWWSPWTWFGYSVVWFVCLLGSYLHPSDELRDAMAAAPSSLDSDADE